MKDKVTICFGESAFYSNEKEEEEAKNYLQYWKKNLLIKLMRDTHEAVLLEESYHTRDASCLKIMSIISIKLIVTIKFQYEIDQCLGIHYGV